MGRVIPATIICALMLVPIHGAAAEEEPVRRSGTIVTGIEWFYQYVLGEETQGCETAPDCQAWLETGCAPTLTGRDPAVMASIENVADLADGVTPWRFEFQADWECCTGWAVVQFWQQDCTEVPDSRWHAANCPDGGSCRTGHLRIAKSARWMTVTGFPSHPWIDDLISGTGWATLEWTLTRDAGGPSSSGPSPTPNASPTPVPPPTSEPATVERSVEFALRGHLRSVGSIVAADASCSSDVPVVVQRKTSDAWFDIVSTTTDADGAFAVSLPDRAGRYRAVASEIESQESTCLAARSATLRHQH